MPPSKWTSGIIVDIKSDGAWTYRCSRANQAYSEESLGIIKRQREMIEKFQTDNDSLKAELDLEMR